LVAPTRDGEWLADLLADSIDLILEYAPEARVLVQTITPRTPYHIAAAAILEYMAAVDAAQQWGNDTVVGHAVTDDKAPPARGAGNGPCKACEVRSCPQAASCPLAYTAGKFEYRVGPNGHVECFITWPLAPCAKASGCCESCPGDCCQI